MNPRRNIQRHRRNQRRHQRWLASFTYVTAAAVTHVAVGLLENRLERTLSFVRAYGDWQ